MKKRISQIGVYTALTALLTVGVNAHTGMVSGTDLTPDSAIVSPAANVIDEVVWVVGDEAILKSDIEVTRLQGNPDGSSWGDDADCKIPEQIAVQKLFLHQAAIDSIEVTQSEVAQGVDQRINYYIQMAGSREELERMQRKSITQMRQEMFDEYKNMLLVQRMKEKLVEDIKVSPAEVRTYFSKLPKDSIPEIPTTVEVQILTQTPKIEQEEIKRVKDELHSYSERVMNGETSFQTLARLYSEDPGSARQGGEIGMTGRGMLDPAFATVAFNLTDPRKVSKIVETDFGYHIIQLIDKRGDRINCRHILLKPHISDESIVKAKERLDSVANDVRAGKFTFETATSYLSDDKDTKSNNGLMANSSENERTSKFRMQDLPAEIAQVIDTMKVGDVSKAFKMVNSKGKTTCAIVKLKSRVEAHRATITEDFQAMRKIVLEKRREEKLHQWVLDKIKDVYVRMNPRYADCNFEYEGWIK